jgi:hypothetical protein
MKAPEDRGLHPCWALLGSRVVNDSPRADLTDAPERIDVDRLADRIDAVIDVRIDSQTRTLAVLLFAQALIVGGLAFAAARLG